MLHYYLEHKCYALKQWRNFIDGENRMTYYLKRKMSILLNTGTLCRQLISIARIDKMPLNKNLQFLYNLVLKQLILSRYEYQH